jgi:hypothetical protein
MDQLSKQGILVFLSGDVGAELFIVEIGVRFKHQLELGIVASIFLVFLLIIYQAAQCGSFSSREVHTSQMVHQLKVLKTVLKMLKCNQVCLLLRILSKVVISIFYVA